MRYSLRLTSLAHHALVNHGQYLADRDRAMARRFLRAVQLSCERLRSRPDLGELWNTPSETNCEYRCWCVRGFEKYVLFYRILPDTIEIERVLHSAQDADNALGLL